MKGIHIHFGVVSLLSYYREHKYDVESKQKQPMPLVCFFVSLPEGIFMWIRLNATISVLDDTSIRRGHSWICAERQIRELECADIAGARGDVRICTPGPRLSDRDAVYDQKGCDGL